MRNQKGFTLVELLAVIVILAIILAIAVPGISGIIDSTKQSAFESDAKLIVKGIEYQKLEFDVGAAGATDPAAGSILTTVDDYGADPDNYTAACITAVSPEITICVTANTSGKFGNRGSITATRSTVTTTASCSCS